MARNPDPPTPPQPGTPERPTNPPPEPTAPPVEFPTETPHIPPLAEPTA